MAMWRVRGFSIQGYAHLMEGSPCQDAYRQAAVGSSVVLAVADGAGSRPRSAEGAALLVTLATEILAGLLKAPGGPGDPPTLKRNLGTAYDRIRAEFLRKASLLGGDGQAGDFAATLVAAVVAGPVVGIIQVGDGFAVVRTTDRAGGTGYHLLSQPTVTGQHANETIFVTSPGAAGPALAVTHDEGITGVLLSTDGLVPAALRRDEGHAQLPNRDFVERVLSHLDGDASDPRLVVRTMLSDGVVGRTGDDLTLLAAVRA
ncbi:MAG TPA: protein phosphatase 2C domain-containing protein [Trebonia sp.]|jgi:hypothetical protein|nr:protein phosphatase 2C domain-containing protein [Trebonia sp.]